jgi:hypothetical protein
MHFRHISTKGMTPPKQKGGRQSKAPASSSLLDASSASPDEPGIVL